MSDAALGAFVGHLQDRGPVEQGKRVTAKTFLTHPWMITDGPGNCIRIILPRPGGSVERLGAAGRAPN